MLCYYPIFHSLIDSIITFSSNPLNRATLPLYRHERHLSRRQHWPTNPTTNPYMKKRKVQVKGMNSTVNECVFVMVNHSLTISCHYFPHSRKGLVPNRLDRQRLVGESNGKRHKTRSIYCPNAGSSW